jgi:hypothetical protein
MNQCSKHPEKEAIGKCLSCGKYLCDDCVAQKKENRLLCYDCAVKVTLDEFDTKEKRGQVIAEARRKKAKKASREGMRNITVLVIVGAIIIVLQGGIILTDYLLRSPGETSFIWSNFIQTRYERDLCAGNLHRLALMVDSYKRDHNGNLPPDLASLAQAGGNSDLACPASGAPYRYTLHEGSFELACPSPEAHGLVFLFDTDGELKWRKAEE